MWFKDVFKNLQNNAQTMHVHRTPLSKHRLISNWQRYKEMASLKNSVAKKEIEKPYFSLRPVFSGWGRERLVREVFQDTELEIFPWKGTLKVSHVYFGPLQHGWFTIFVWDQKAAIGGGDEDARCCDARLQRLWRSVSSVHNFNSEQRNCLVILSLSGSDLRLKSDPDCLI